MDLGAATTVLGEAFAASVCVDADRTALKGSLRAITRWRSVLTALEASYVARLQHVSVFPEKDLAETGRTSLGSAVKTAQRADVLAQALCVRHHTDVHEYRLTVTLGPRRQLTILDRDGFAQTTGPPSRSRRAA